MISKPKVLRSFLSTIAQHSSRVITVKEAALRIHVDPSDLNRICYFETGKRAKALLDDEFKRRVIHDLKTTCLMGYEIAAKMGFSDPRNFYRKVTRIFGKGWSSVEIDFRTGKRN
ncbi:MAG: hypothetical protein V1799_01410 [bacterium]